MWYNVMKWWLTKRLTDQPTESTEPKRGVCKKKKKIDDERAGRNRFNGILHEQKSEKKRMMHDGGGKMIKTGVMKFRRTQEMVHVNNEKISPNSLLIFLHTI